LHGTADHVFEREREMATTNFEIKYKAAAEARSASAPTEYSREQHHFNEDTRVDGS
jgi:hypothetical protein